MTANYEFKGWLGKDAKSVEGNMEWGTYEPKPWTEDDVDIKITHSGICGSDCHTLRSGWGASLYPVVVGHEIVGEAVKVGKNVSHVKVGDRVGVGAQNASCQNFDGKCEECSNNEPQYCARKTDTYNSKYLDGSKSYGGYAEYHRATGPFVVKIPDGLESRSAAPMLCGGVTVYSPLKRNGAGPGKRVGIVGIGGLGHFGVLFAKALGADEVVAISRSRSKEEDARKLGATHFIATGEQDWSKNNQRSLDLIISTVSSPDLPLALYLRLLRTHGQFIQVGAPEDKLPAFNAFSLIAKGCKIGGSSIGSPQEISEMLNLAAKNKIHPWTEERPMKEANKAVVDFEDGKPRYRYVLINENQARI